jgi:hypothetical protein
MNHELNKEAGMKSNGMGLDGILSDGHGVFGRVGGQINRPVRQALAEKDDIIERLKVLVWTFGVALVVAGAVIAGLCAAK